MSFAIQEHGRAPQTALSMSSSIERDNSAHHREKDSFCDSELAGNLYRANGALPTTSFRRDGDGAVRESGKAPRLGAVRNLIG